MKAPETGTVITVVYIAAFFIALFIVYKILGSVGLIKTRAKKKEEKVEKEAATDLRKMIYFDPLYLKNRSDYKPLGTQGKYYAGEIKSAMAGFGTDEERIFATFSKLPSKETIAELALYFTSIFKKSLIVELLNELTDEEQVTLLSIINKLPDK